MAYEAVPDDVEIQKLTSAQRDALSRYKIHENINTFLGNENTPLLIGAAGLALLLPGLIDALLQAQEDALNMRRGSRSHPRTRIFIFSKKSFGGNNQKR